MGTEHLDGALSACTLTSTTSEIERKTPFFMWKDIFEHFLARLTADTALFTRPPLCATRLQRCQ